MIAVARRRCFTLAVVASCLILLSVGVLLHGRGEASYPPPPGLSLPSCTPGDRGIARRLHQMWKNTTIPDKWVSSQKACRGHNENYEYFLWTDDEMERFITQHYPWFLSTYHSYPYPIQKVDAARYFILYHYGGVYVDLDLECQYSFDFVIRNISRSMSEGHGRNLLTRPNYEVILAKTTPTGVTNALMMARQCSAFFRSLLTRLPRANRHYVFPYPTVMLSTGPLFLTFSLSGYEASQHEIYTFTEFQYHHVLFRHGAGSSWHTWDGRIIKIINHQCVYATMLLLAIILLILWLRRVPKFDTHHNSGKLPHHVRHSTLSYGIETRRL